MMSKQRFTISERILKWTKKTKKHNFIIMLVITIVAILLIALAMSTQKTEAVKGMAKKKNDIQMTYLGDVNMDKHMRVQNLNHVFDALSNVLKHSDFSTASLETSKLSDNRTENIKKNIENIMFLKGLNIKSLNLVNDKLDNKQIQDLSKDVESQTSYNFLTGNGSNLINSKTVQQTVKGKKIATLSLTDTRSDYTNSLKSTTSVSMEPRIFIPLIKKLKEQNDYVVVNADWGIPNERQVTSRQREFAHAIADSGADVIIGHNGVIQEAEKYKDTNIFYSIGNVTSEGFLSKEKHGLVVQQNWNGKDSKFKLTPIKTKSGIISEDHPNKVEETKLLNNLQSNNVGLKKENGGYVYEN
ncbi:CapA family protein [Staphylococcus sp. SQ8-PEA]|uniref:CapA family protein n=1 Tax=Staphylococcus marylandisciuri TaxID=2981529 RepID=A0ABT2QMY6_9STAP|nr:CapA family protein [Staphylococcus marylandisciuri]MCU5745351.1 CapA family protein [Staphylococcus marylandisciuri]